MRPQPLAVLKAMARASAGMNVLAVEKIHEDARDDAFQVLIATMLSAQTKDAVTEVASARLFRRAPDAVSLAALPVSRIERLIFPVSFYRTKARHVRETARQLLQRFGGEVPARIEDLLTLPGVGRKTATLVLILSYGSRSHICVDTHVHRLANRLGWVTTNTPERTEQALYRAVPRPAWPDVNLRLVTWGQNVCRPISPRCSICAVSRLCPKIGVLQQRTVPHATARADARALPRPPARTAGTRRRGRVRLSTDHRDGQGHD